MATRSTDPISSSVQSGSRKGSVGGAEVLSENTFHRMISLERKRSERSQRPFVLLLVDTCAANG